MDAVRPQRLADAWKFFTTLFEAGEAYSAPWPKAWQALPGPGLIRSTRLQKPPGRSQSDHHVCANVFAGSCERSSGAWSPTYRTASHSLIRTALERAKRF